MKISRVEFDRFWDDALGRCWYDDGDHVDDDKSDVGLVDLDYVCPRWQGDGQAEPNGILKQRDIDRDFLAVSATALYRRWRKAQTTTVVVASFEVPNEGKDALLAQIKALKGKVLS